MDETEAQAVIKYQQNKGMTPKKIHEDTVQILVKDSSSYASPKKWVAEFKQVRGSTEDDP